MNQTDILALFDQWNQALNTGDAKQVTALYADEAVLLPTISNEVRTDHKAIERYFTAFLKQRPRGAINQSNARLHQDLAFNSGIYTFTLHNNTQIQARFTFVYRLTKGEWKIIEHHSSQMPET